MTNILTAQEFIDQGTTAGAIMSIASANPAKRAALEKVARQVADRTGQTLQIPGALTASRNERRRPSNDNRERRVAA
jgi:hypothetical protein